MALITFKSKAAGEIFMFRETAEKIFKIIGKPLGLRGVLTPEELPLAIDKIKLEMEEEKKYLKAIRAKEDQDFRQGKELDKEKTNPIEAPVFFTQRAYPLLEMMQLSLKDNQPVMWGV